MDENKEILANFACLATFPDVPCDYWAVEAVEGIYDAGIVFGYPDGFYRPMWEVGRAAMATYIARALCGGAVPSGPAEATFPDVPDDHWAYDALEYTVAHGVVEGYDDDRYHPDWIVTRGQMAVFVARAMSAAGGEGGISDYVPPEAPSFSDVAADHWAYADIEYLAGRGVVAGYPDGRYRPARRVTRDQMAVYIARAFGIIG
jgi:hypothetical protein